MEQPKDFNSQDEQQVLPSTSTEVLRRLEELRESLASSEKPLAVPNGVVERFWEQLRKVLSRIPRL